MIKIGYQRECSKVQNSSQEIIDVVTNTLEILDSKYGEDRDKYKDDGGYVIVIEKKDDFKKIKIEANIDCDNISPEYVDKIVCSNDEIYTNSLILCNNDFGISLIIPLELTPQNLKDYIID